jgi:hypothetical protein
MSCLIPPTCAFSHHHHHHHHQERIEQSDAVPSCAVFASAPDDIVTGYVVYAEITTITSGSTTA